MTSSAQECFVYITLPGNVEPVTAGRFELQADRTGAPVGRFVYGRSYLERNDAVEFDPIELRLSPRRYETVALGGVFGALRDAGPDYWGRRCTATRPVPGSSTSRPSTIGVRPHVSPT